MMRAIVCLLAWLFALPALAQIGLFNQSSGSFDANPAALLSTVQLTSATSQTAPVTFASVFECGTTTKPSTNISNQQSEVLATCNDGSARLVQFTVVPTLSAGVPLDVEIYSTAAAEGADLTAADIASAGLTASVFLDMVSGTDVDFDLGDLTLTSPDEITVQGPEMIEAMWDWRGGTNNDVLIKTWIRRYADGRAHVRFAVITGRFGAQLYETAFEKQYVPTVTIGGATAWNNGAATFTHNEWARWDVEGWINGDPGISYTPDTDLMQASKVVPTYWRTNPSETALNAQYDAYTPGDSGSWDPAMGSAGYKDGIGSINNWDAFVVTSGGDQRAIVAAVENAKAINSFPVTFMDENTNTTVKPSDRADWTLYGSLSGGGGQGTGTTNTGGGLTFDLPHHGSAGKMAYILGGHPADYLTMRNVASLCYLMQNAQSGGTSVNRIYYSENRSRAWCTRSLSDIAGLARPGDTIAAEYKTMLDNNITEQLSESNVAGQNDLGFFYLYVASGTECPFANTANKCVISKFMDYFWITQLGHLDEMDVISDETDLHALMDNFYRVVIGLGGAGGADAFCYNIAFAYNMTVGDTNDRDPTTWYDDGATTAWKQAYDATCADTSHPASCDAPLTACTGTLKGDQSSAMLTQGGNYLTALSAALNYPSTRTSALAALARFKADSQWPTVVASEPQVHVWSEGDPADFQ